MAKYYAFGIACLWSVNTAFPRMAVTGNRGGEKLCVILGTKAPCQIVRKAVRYILVERDGSGCRYVLAVRELQLREWHMRAIKAASMYVAAGFGVRIARHQFSSISSFTRIHPTPR